MLNPGLRRFLSGAWLDLKSMPERVCTPARWREPWQWRHNVGGGDFVGAGRELLLQLVRYGGLKPECDVLDIGCGAGRVAAALARYLHPGHRYVGFDVAPGAIAACRRNLGAARPDFTFVQADLRNAEYRRKGTRAETDYAFPVADGSVDIAFAFSVFSHMQIDPIAHYLRESRRVLRPGGRLVFTAYALTPDRFSALERGEGSRRFHAWRDGAMVLDPRSPERAIAHPLDRLTAAVAQAGLGVPRILQGAWIGSAEYAGGQDLFVATRAA